MFTAAYLIDEAEKVLQDTANVRYAAADLLIYLNEAQRDIATRTISMGLSPAYTKTQPVRLEKGLIQSVPEDCIRLIDVKRNLGREWVTTTKYSVDQAVYVSQAITAYADAGDSRYVTVSAASHGLSTGDVIYIYGSTSYNGRWTIVKVDAGSFNIEALYVADDGASNYTADQLRYVCSAGHTAGTFATDLAASKWVQSPLNGGANIEQWNEYNLDQLMPQWKVTDPADDSVVSYWIPTSSNHNKWYCYPNQPNDTNMQYVEMTYSAIPKPQPSAAVLTLGDVYATAVIDFIVYRAYSRDDDVMESGPRATAFFNLYLQNPIFGIK